VCDRAIQDPQLVVGQRDVPQRPVKGLLEHRRRTRAARSPRAARQHGRYRRDRRCGSAGTHGRHWGDRSAGPEGRHRSAGAAGLRRTDQRDRTARPTGRARELSRRPVVPERAVRHRGRQQWQHHLCVAAPTAVIRGLEREPPQHVSALHTGAPRRVKNRLVRARIGPGGWVSGPELRAQLQQLEQRLDS
jgi:hypothetical protein